MNKAVKVTLTLVVVIILAFAALLAYVLLALDPNGYKPQLENAAREQGVELHIDGDLGWRLFPTIAIQLGETRFESETHGIRPSSVQEVNLAVGWRELLQKRIAIKALAIDRADIHLTSSEQAAAIAAVPASGDQPVSTDDKSFSLGVEKFSIANSTVSLEENGNTTLLSNINLSTSDVSLTGDEFPLAISLEYRADSSAEPIRLDLDASLSLDQQAGKLLASNTTISVDGAMPESIKLTFSAAVDIENQSGELTDLSATVGKTTLTGTGAYRHSLPRSLQLNLKGTELNTADLLAQDATAESTGESDTAADSEATNLLAAIFAPLAILEGGTGNIDLTMDKIIHSGIELDNMRLSLDAEGNKLTINEFSGAIFGGTVNATAVVTNSATPRVTFNKEVTNIDLASAFAQFADDVDITGTLNLKVAGETRGADSDALLDNLKASGDLQVENPVLATINIEQKYCEIAALVENTPKRSEPWPQGTRLDNLVSQFRIEDGKLYLDDYSTAIGNLKVRGDGEILIDEQAFSIAVITRLEGDSTSAEGCAVKSTRVRDKDIPLLCEDSFATAGARSCKPDPEFMNALLQNEVIDKIREKTNLDEEKVEKLEGLLRGFLGGKKDK